MEDSSLYSPLSTTSVQVTLSDYFAQSPDQTQAVFLLAKSKAKQHDTLCSREPCSYTTLLKEKNLLDYFLHNFLFLSCYKRNTHSSVYSLYTSQCRKVVKTHKNYQKKKNFFLLFYLTSVHRQYLMDIYELVLLLTTAKVYKIIVLPCDWDNHDHHLHISSLFFSFFSPNFFLSSLRAGFFSSFHSTKYAMSVAVNAKI